MTSTHTTSPRSRASTSFGGAPRHLAPAGTICDAPVARPTPLHPRDTHWLKRSTAFRFFRRRHSHCGVCATAGGHRAEATNAKKEIRRNLENDTLGAHSCNRRSKGQALICRTDHRPRPSSLKWMPDGNCRPAASAGADPGRVPGTGGKTLPGPPVLSPRGCGATASTAPVLAGLGAEGAIRTSLPRPEDEPLRVEIV